MTRVRLGLKHRQRVYPSLSAAYAKPYNKKYNFQVSGTNLWPVRFGSLGCTSGQTFFRSAYRLLGTRDCWASKVFLSTEVVRELEWWLHSVDQWNERLICSEQVQGQIVTDASHLGWGAVYD